LLGLGGDASGKDLVFKPALPADWPEMMIESFRLGPETFDLRFKREDAKVLVEVISRPGNGFQFSYSPAFGPGTRVRRALVTAS
jgi:cellobiose phosphorylase